MDDVYLHIARLCDQWRRFSKVRKVSGPERPNASRGHWRKVTADIRKGVGKADKVMLSLGTLASQKLSRTASTERAEAGKKGRARK